MSNVKYLPWRRMAGQPDKWDSIHRDTRIDQKLHELEETNSSWKHSKLHQDSNQSTSLQENEHRSFCSLIYLWPWKISNYTLKPFLLPHQVFQYKPRLKSFVAVFGGCGSLCLFLTKWSQLDYLPWILIGQDEKSMRFIKPLSLNSTPNSIQINLWLWTLIGMEVFVFLRPCHLDQGQSLWLVS